MLQPVISAFQLGVLDGLEDEFPVNPYDSYLNSFENKKWYEGREYGRAMRNLVLQAREAEQED